MEYKGPMYMYRDTLLARRQNPMRPRPRPTPRVLRNPAGMCLCIGAPPYPPLRGARFLKSRTVLVSTCTRAPLSRPVPRVPQYLPSTTVNPVQGYLGRCIESCPGRYIYEGTPLTRQLPPIGPYPRPVPRVIRGSQGVGLVGS